jgi:putative ABC transport system permease protein
VPQRVSQIFESIKLALGSIWSNKLRSLLTLLGNIVAVSSIITVVSLIQGMNATVSDAVMSDLGADTFTIDRMGMITSEEEMDRARNNPRITIEEALAIERFSDHIDSVMAQANTSAPIAYESEEIESVRIQGVTGDYQEFSTFDAERGRMISTTEIERSRPVVILGWEVADRLFAGADPLEKVVRIRGVHFRVIGVSHLRQFDGFVCGDSAGAVPQAVWLAAVIAGHGQAACCRARADGEGRCARGASRQASAGTGRA